MNQNLISEEDLLTWTGYKQRADAIKWLKHRYIPYDLGRGGRICVIYDDLVQSRQQVNELRLINKHAA